MRSFFNIVAPAERNALAFTISDGSISACARRGTSDQPKSVFVGNFTHGHDGGRV